MTQLWKNGGIATDRFQVVDDASPLPTSTPVVVSLKRWREHRAEVLAAGVPIGVALDATSTLSVQTDALDQLSLIVIPFAKFTDGRGYSLARLLRDELGFTGELRATGDVLIDQIPLMLRCGFDAFAISHAPTLRALQAGHLPAIAEVYQTATSGRARTTTAVPARRPLAEAAE